MQQADNTALNLDYAQYSRPQKEELLALFREKERRVNSRQVLSLYPDTGPLRRELYVPHTKFFAAGAKYRERCLMAANRVGKTYGVGGYELTLHLTGQYPPWWKGKRFDRPIRSWACGTTGQTVRDIVQRKLLGPINDLGTGLIPGDCIIDYKKKAGNVPDTIETVYVKHITGGISTVGLKCHPAKERILTKTGAWANIEDIKIGAGVALADGKIGIVTQTHSYANADVLEIQAEGGRLRVTPNHKVFLKDGRTVDAGKLQVGDVLALSPSLSVEKTGTVDDKEKDWLVVLTAVMIGDGCTRGKTPFFTCNDPEQVEALRKYLPDNLIIKRVRNTISYKISGNTPNYNRLTKNLRKDGLWNKLSKHKFIPNWIFGLSVEQKKLFLFWLWSCDGTINKKRASYTSASYRLAEDVNLLLHSVGIYANVRRYKVKLHEKYFDCNMINLHGENRLLFTEIGKFNRDCTCNMKPRPKYVLGEIFSIDGIGKQTVYGIGVEGCHEYIAGGFRVGNSYEQGRKAFEGDEQDCVLLDEEPPVDIYTECLTRTMTTQGIVMLLFTPLQGLSDTVLLFMPGGQIPSSMGKRFVIQATWNDAPHLSQQDKDDIISSYSPHERDARSKGIPQLGSGRVYPISEDDLLVDDFVIPEHWIQAYGFDVGWKATAATWGALNRESDVLYLHSCYKQGEEKPVVHAASVKARGEWVPGLADPAALGRGQKDGSQLIVEYNDLGLKLVPAENPVEAGILKLYKRMTTGRLKVFRSMVQWLEEFRIYRRDEKGKIIKDFDHLMDTTRYLNNSIVSVGIVRPINRNVHVPGESSGLTSGWAR